MIRKTILACVFGCLALTMLQTASAELDGDESSGALVLFLTQTDPMVAGHALHFATRMHMEGRAATIVLVGDAGRIALKDSETPVSAVSEDPLRVDLAGFIEAGGRVLVTPYTLKSLGVSEDALIDGAALPRDPRAIHAHMFESGTKMVVW